MVMCAIANTDDVVVAAPAAVVLADAVVAVIVVAVVGDVVVIKLDTSLKCARHLKELTLSLENCNAGKN